MTLQELGSLGEFIAAIATIATLIYLALQIRHNTAATREQSTRALMLANSEATGSLASDPQLADVLMRGAFDRNALKPVEQFQFNSFFFAYYNQVDYAYSLHRSGKLDTESWEKIANEIPVYLSSPGLKDWWAEDRIRFSPAFVEYVESVVKDQPERSKLPSVPARNEMQKAPPNKSVESDT